MMSPDEDWNFMTRLGVDTMAPSMFGEGHPKRTLYDVWVSTTRKRMGMVLVWQTFAEKDMEVDIPATHSFSGESINGLI